MGKSKKQSAPWVAFVQGTLLSLALYLLLQMLMALLLVKAVLPEEKSFLVVSIVCALCAFIGGLFCIRRSSIGKLPSGLISAAGFAVLLIVIGLLCWNGITWMGQGGILLLCALAGGVLAGLLGGKRGRRVKHKIKRK